VIAVAVVLVAWVASLALLVAGWWHLPSPARWYFAASAVVAALGAIVAKATE
jgi:hypothetical protein